MTNHPETAQHIPPLSPDSLLLALSQLSEEQFDHLLAEVQGPDGFRLESRERRDRLGARLSLTPNRVGDLLSVLNSIYLHMNPRANHQSERRREGSILELIGGLEYLPSLPNAAEFLPKIAKRLQAITTRSPHVEKLRKINRLRQGFHPNALSFSSMVDLRPDYSDDRSRIESLVPVIQLRITTDAETQDRRQLVFQISVERLGDLESMLADVRAKVKCLDTRAEFAQMLVKKT